MARHVGSSFGPAEEKPPGETRKPQNRHREQDQHPSHGRSFSRRRMKAGVQKSKSSWDSLFSEVVLVEIDPLATGVGIGPVLTRHPGQGPITKDVLFDLWLVLFAVGQILFFADARTVLAARHRYHVIGHGIVSADNEGPFHRDIGGASAKNKNKDQNRDETHGRLPSESH